MLQSPRRRPLRFVREDTVVVEVMETTISPLTKSTSSKVQYDLMWEKMMELHQHVQQDSTENYRVKNKASLCLLQTEDKFVLQNLQSLLLPRYERQVSSLGTATRSISYKLVLHLRYN